MKEGCRSVDIPGGKLGKVKADCAREDVLVYVGIEVCAGRKREGIWGGCGRCGMLAVGCGGRWIGVQASTNSVTSARIRLIPVYRLLPRVALMAYQCSRTLHSVSPITLVYGSHYPITCL